AADRRRLQGLEHHRADRCRRRAGPDRCAAVAYAGSAEVGHGSALAKPRGRWRPRYGPHGAVPGIATELTGIRGCGRRAKSSPYIKTTDAANWCGASWPYQWCRAMCLLAMSEARILRTGCRI